MNDRDILYNKLLKLKAESNNFDFIKRLYENFASKQNYGEDIVAEVFNQFVEDFKGAQSIKPKYLQVDPDLKSHDADIIAFD